MCYIVGGMKTISLRDANQSFARCVRAVEAGEEFTITRNGVPVARLVPASARRTLTPAQEAALARSLARAAEGWDVGMDSFDRDALHER